MRGYGDKAIVQPLPSRVALMVLALLLAVTGTAWGQQEGYQLGAGDQISIVVAGSPEFDTTTRIRHDGTIGFPYLGAVELAGLTAREAAQKLEQGLRSARLLQNPQVLVTIEEYLSRQVTVMGEVASPGRYGLSGPTTVLDVIARAGGIQPDGADHVILVRRADGEPTRYHLELDELTSGKYFGAQVQAGDTLMVPRMNVFYIEGAVASPGVYRLEEDMTVMQALAVGGGVTPRGSTDRIVVKRRGEDGEMHTYSADLNDVLKPNDVVRVKERIF